MNPEDLDDRQLYRLMGMTLAVIWTAPGAVGLDRVCDYAELIADFIETGRRPE